MATNEVAIHIRAYNKTKTAFNGVNSSMGKLRHTAMNLRFAMAGIGSALMVKSLVDASVGMEKLTLGMQGATGSAEAGAKEFAYLNETVDRLKLDLRTSGEAFTLLTAASRGTALEGQATRDAFEAIAISSKVLGRSAADTSGVLYALQQMISKGKVTSEELRRQMGDRLPGAFKMAAKAMNMTEAELDSAMRKGEIYSTDFVPKFTKVLMEAFAGQLPDALTTTQSKLDEMNTAFFRMKASMAQSGVVDIVKDFADVLIEFAESEAFSSAIDDMGAAIRNNRDDIKDFISATGQLAEITALALGKLAIGIGAVISKYKEFNDAGLTWQIPGLRDMEALSLAMKMFDNGNKKIDFSQRDKSRAEYLSNLNNKNVAGTSHFDLIADDIASRRDKALLDAEIAAINAKNESNVAKVIALYEANLGTGKLAGMAAAEGRVESTIEQLKQWNAEQDKIDADATERLKEYAKSGEGIGDMWLKAAEGMEQANARMDEMSTTTNDWLLGAYAGLEQYVEYIGDAHDGMEQTVTKAFSSMEDSIVEFAMTGKTSFKDLANSIIQDMMRIVVQQSITQPLASGIMRMFGSSTTAYPNAFPSGGVASYSAGYAKGGAFGPNGVIKAFANGGIVNNPTLFPFANGTGLMGEAGPEAIMPLKRINGKLGVEASGGGTSISQSISVDARGSSVSAQDIEQAVQRGAEEGYRKVYSDITRRGPIRKAL